MLKLKTNLGGATIYQLYIFGVCLLHQVRTIPKHDDRILDIPDQ